MVTKRAAVYPLAMTAVLAALMAVTAPFSVAIGPVPLSFCTLVIYLAGELLGGRRAALATLAYILLGAVGMPVFSGFSAGLGVLAGPTGGYVVGYLPLAALSGLAAARFPRRRESRRPAFSRAQPDQTSDTSVRQEYARRPNSGTGAPVSRTDACRGRSWALVPTITRSSPGSTTKSMCWL